MPNKAISYVLYYGATVGNGYGNRNGVSIEDTRLLGFLFPYCLLFIKVMYVYK
nr:MAG TPA: transmembrane protein [Caudoviricetes sp.]DAV00396.1 MAG TPA: transmembrane protein [Caudoviricetes sp.]